jgi:hypothetical protein
MRSFRKCKKMSSFYKSLFLKPVFRIRIGFRIRIQLFTSRRIHIRIQGAKPMRIHADPNADHGQTLLSQKVGSWHEKYTFRRYYVIKHTYVGLKASLKGSGFRESQINADRCGSGSETLLKTLGHLPHKRIRTVFMLILSMRQDP